MMKAVQSEADVLNDIEARAKKGKASVAELELLQEAYRVYKVGR